MGDILVSAVEWQENKGKWMCSLICYDGIFSQVWLEVDRDISFKVQRGQYCIGYTTLSSPTSNVQVVLESWKSMEPCPSKTELKRGHKCSSCSSADLLRPCLICDGMKCLADLRLREICQKATAYVYIASFGSNQIKAGVANSTRIPQRWIEQGANMAKRVIIGNGMEARRYEKAIHRALNVLPAVRTEKKADTLWKQQDIEGEADALAKAEQEIKRRFPEFPFYHELPHDLSTMYNLPSFNRRLIEIEIRENQQVSGKILGVKGSLLLLEKSSLPYFINLNDLLGRKIQLNEDSKLIMQTALDIY